MDPNALRLGIVTRSQIISVGVCTTTSTVKKYCKMKLQMCGKATVYNEGWTEAVQDFNLHEEDVCVFRFKDDRVIPKIHRDPAAWLTMEIVKLEEEA